MDKNKLFAVDVYNVELKQEELDKIIKRQGYLIGYIKACRHDGALEFNQLVSTRNIHKKRNSKLYSKAVRRIAEMLKNLKALEAGYQRGMSVLKGYENFFETSPSYAGYDAPFYVSHEIVDEDVFFVGHEDFYANADVGLTFLLKYIHQI